MDFDSEPHPISWFKDQYNADTLTLKPPYQRKPVWTEKQKCYLIESILLELPIPEVYVQHATSADGRTTYSVVDGQQRIRTILQFIGCDRDAEEQAHNNFTLEKLNADSPWRDKSFSALTPEQKKKFYAYRLCSRNLNTDNDDSVRDMFRRLNKYLAPLRAQELRNATFQGPFLRLSEQLADDEYWVDNRIVSPAQIRRMNDIEFVSELLIGTINGPQGGAASVIDEYYTQFEDYEDEFPEQKTSTKLFNSTLTCIKGLLPKIDETRWSNKTDFYTLFVAVASLHREGRLTSTRRVLARKALTRFSREVELRLSDENYDAADDVVKYVRAHEKGANDKKRRGDRHVVIVNLLRNFFSKRN